MIHSFLLLCGQPPVIYHPTHWIKTDRIFRKNYGVLYSRKEALNCGNKMIPEDEVYSENVPTYVLYALTAWGFTPGRETQDKIETIHFLKSPTHGNIETNMDSKYCIFPRDFLPNFLNNYI